MSMTPKQAERQNHRNGGQYAKVNPCDGCGRSAGVEYCSHPLTDCTGDDGEDWADTALVLCGRCANATVNMRNVSEFLAFAAARAKR